MDICDGWLVDPGPDRLANFWGRSIHPKLSTCTVYRRWNVHPASEFGGGLRSEGEGREREMAPREPLE